MCGITGIVNFNKDKPVTKQCIKHMNDVISHRGPDDEGIFLDHNMGLGHRRLSIIDLSSAGHQPMTSLDQRYAITYNGEVYNYKELRQELVKLGYNFQSQTDTEVVLYSYIEWGSKCLKKLNGMFVIAIWDSLEKNIFLARDRYGIKPLYYIKTEDELIFASEIKPILKARNQLYNSHIKLNKSGLLEYLTFQNFFTDQTLFNNIRMLMPGNYVLANIHGKFDIIKYWDFDFHNAFDIPEQEAIEEIDRLFKQAISRQLVSDVPVNAYLSGGIDSGSISVLASKLRPGLKTFTIGFDLSSASGIELSYDERRKAEHISYLAGTEHYEMVLKSGDMRRCMSEYTRHLEEPRVGQSYPNYYAAKLASKFGKVVLSGAGGDELFGGYPWRYFYSKNNISFEQFINAYYLKWQRLFSSQKLQQLLAPIWNDIDNIDTKAIFENVFKDIKPTSSHEQIDSDRLISLSMYLEAKTFLHGILTVEDKLSMAHGLESRVPFLDNDLVDFALKIPNKYKITNIDYQVNENDLKNKFIASNNGKTILRKTLSRYLDSEIINDNKQGFSSPDGSWFRGDSIEYVQNQLKYLPDIFDRKIVDSIVSEHVAQKQNNRLAIWSLLYINSFFKEFLNYE